ncbi:MAG: T9SS type A sorting domain-containing protein [Bacteroidia bacterium]|nr:T9SS type A sorting domain-containing protein [Bacteroidia bacterium]
MKKRDFTNQRRLKEAFSGAVSLLGETLYSLVNSSQGGELRKIKVIVCAMVSVFYFQNMNANHLTGADLWYECLGNDMYQIYLTRYHDCDNTNPTPPPNHITGFGGTVTIEGVGCSPGTVMPAFSPFTLVGTDILDAVCPNMSTKCHCGGSNIKGIIALMYTATIDLSGINCNGVNIDFGMTSWDNDPSGGGILVNGAGGNVLYLDNIFINLQASPCNNSPILNVPDTYQICCNDTAIISFQATDPDGDQLTYNLIDCTQGPGTSVTYTGLYSGTIPLGDSTGLGDATLDPVTGELTLQSNGDLCNGLNPMLQFGTTVCIEIIETRLINGQMVIVGRTLRDLEVVIGGCPVNQAPEALLVTNVTGAYFDSNNQQPPVYDFYLCPNDTFSFWFTIIDPDVLLATGLNMTHSPLNGIGMFPQPGGAVTNQLTAAFPPGNCGLPPNVLPGFFVWTGNGTPGVYTLEIYGSDNGCMNAAIDTFIFNFHVINNQDFTIDKRAVNTPASGLYGPGDLVEYEITVQNTSTTFPLTNIVVNDEIPFGLDIGSFNPINFPSPPTFNGNLMSTLIPSLAAGQSITFSYTINIDNFTAADTCFPSSIVNCADIVDANYLVCDTLSECDTIYIQNPFYLITMLPNTTANDMVATFSIPYNPGSGSYEVINQNVDLLGDFTIDLPVRFINCRIRVAPQATITTIKRLWLDNTHLFACEEMWEGIDVVSNNIISENNTVIEDALNAIRLRTTASGSFIAFTHFRQNFNGIFIDQMPTGLNPQTHIIDHDVFEGVATLQAHPAYPQALGWSYSGIHLNDMAQQNVTYCTFKDITNGILAYRTNLTVTKSTFEGMNAGTLSNGTSGYQLMGIAGFNYNQCAIYITGQNQSLIQQGIGSGVTDPYTFNNCKYGIVAERMNTVISGNRARVIRAGFVNAFYDWRILNVYDNRIETEGRGMHLMMGDNATVSDVFGNSIDCGITLSSPSVIARGIELAHLGQANNLRMWNNHIYLYDGGTTGIRLSGAGKGNIFDNHIYPNTQWPLSFGINVEGTDDADIFCNTVFGITPPTTDITQHGIRLSLSPNNYLGGNQVNHTSRGFSFDGMCNNTDFRRNTMNEHFFGLFLNGIISTQNLKANEFLAAPGVCNFEAFDVGGVGGFSLFNIHVPQLPANTFWPDNTNNPIWFNPGVGTPDPIVYCNYALIGDSTGFDSTDYRIAEGNLNAPQFPDETQWMGERALYERISENPEVAENDVVMSDFYTTKQNDAVGQLSGIALASDSVGISSDSLLLFYESERAALAEMLRVKDSLILVTPSDSTLWLGADSLRIWVQSLQQLMYQREYQLHQQRNGALTTLEAQNSSIMTTFMPEANEQKINEIYFATIAREIYTFTPTQLADIISIANQCPLAGGMSVYKARSLYAIVNDEAEYDDTGVCNALGMSMRKPQNTLTIEEGFKVYPNPVQSQLTVRWDKKDHPSEIIIIDIMGKEVVQSFIAEESTETILSVDGLPSGVYILLVKDNMTVIHQEKIIVQSVR